MQKSRPHPPPAPRGRMGLPIIVKIAAATYSLATVYPNGTATYDLNCPNGNQYATCGTAHLYGGDRTYMLGQSNSPSILNPSAALGACLEALLTKRSQTSSTQTWRDQIACTICT